MKSAGALGDGGMGLWKGRWPKMSAEMAPASQPGAAGRAASWPASRLLGRPVVHVRIVAQVGEVMDVVFSPERRQLVGLLIGSAGTEGGLLETLRRVLGMDLGLRFVPIQRVLALNADVVMIDMEPGEQPVLPDRRHLPRLRLACGYAVITMQGQRLGRLADLLLDAEGRRLAGYVVERQSASPVAAPAALVPGASSNTASPTPVPAPVSTPISSPTSSRFMIPARLRVRFGHRLIVAGEDVSRPVVAALPSGPSAEWPAPHWAGEPVAAPAESPEELAAPPDAPTEQLPPSV